MSDDRHALRRRLSRLLLVVGLGLTLVYLLPRVPRDQTLVFRVPEHPVERLDVSFTLRGEPEAWGGFSLTHPFASARDVRHQVELPNGDYEMSIELVPPDEAAERVRETRFVRRVTLDGGETIISL